VERGPGNQTQQKRACHEKDVWPQGFAGTVKSRRSANGLRTVLNFQRVGTQRYFDTAGFPGRTFGLELEGRKQKRRGNDPAAWT
jgi:hypothetical protein